MTVLLSLLPLAALEGALRWADVAPPPLDDRRLVAEAAQQRLFVLAEDGGSYVTHPARREYFREQTFSAIKPAGTFRMFFLGGSTVQGHPYSVETAFPTWLRLNLEAAQSSRAWEAINCGGVSYASYRLAPIFEEILQYEPDLIVLCSGHNEFLEDTAFRALRDDPTAQSRLHLAMSQSRTYNLLRSALLQATGQSDPPEVVAALPAEVDALLDHRGGLEWYRRDDPWRQEVIDRYERNVRRMLDQGRRAGVPVIVVNPVANVRHCAPFKHQPSAGLSDDARRRFDRLWAKAKAQADDDPEAAAQTLRQALALDRRHAAAWYLLGHCLDRLRDYEQAKEAYLRAKDEDVCPLRILEPMSETLRRAAADGAAGWVDARALFEARSPQGLVGDDTMIDHVHPHIRGHEWIAEALYEEMTRLGLIQLETDVASLRPAIYREHLTSLNAAYYERGRQRLEGLRLWTEGRARRAGAKPLP